jgi:hypothetical protein
MNELSFIRLLDFFRTKPLLVIFAQIKVSFTTVVSLFFCMLRVFCIIVLYYVCNFVLLFVILCVVYYFECAYVLF